MDLMDPTGGEKLCHQPVKTRTPRLKNPESLARSRGGESGMREVLM